MRLHLTLVALLIFVGAVIADSPAPTRVLSRPDVPTQTFDDRISPDKLYASALQTLFHNTTRENQARIAAIEMALFYQDSPDEEFELLTDLYDASDDDHPLKPYLRLRLIRAACDAGEMRQVRKILLGDITSDTP